MANAHTADLGDADDDSDDDSDDDPDQAPPDGEPMVPATGRTEAQRQASRVNGARSKGPTSVDGKRASSMRALKHGGWAGPRAVAAGPLQEDQDDLDRQLAAHINALNPCDDATRRVAEEIAAVFLSLDRVGRKESLALSQTKQPYDPIRGSSGLTPERVAELLAQERTLATMYAAAAAALSRKPDDNTTKDWLTLFKARAIDLGRTDEFTQRISDRNYKSEHLWGVIRGHLKDHYGSLEAGREAYDRKSQHHPYADREQIELEQNARSPIHLDVLERLANVKSRKYADLVRLLKVYDYLKDNCPGSQPDDTEHADDQDSAAP